MVQRSWFYQNGLFYTILVLVLLIHLILLATRMYKNFDLVDTSTPERSQTGPPLRVKIVSDTRPVVKKQIVQSENPETLDKPSDSSYLSDRNRKFDRESVARKVDTFKASGKGKDSISLSDLGAFKKGHDPLKVAAKNSIAGKPHADPEKRGVSSTNDYVEDVPLGDMTYLNTVEYKYYGFYYRIRQRLEQFWGRSIQEKAESLMKQGRQIASNDNLITSLEITLNEIGQIIGIAIKGSSGVQDLDQAAIESFNQAGPFPNPPKGLCQGGRVKIEWGFVVQT